MPALAVEPRLQDAQASVVAAHELSRSGAQASLLHSMWDQPGPMEPPSPALAGGFLTAEPPGKPFRAASICISYWAWCL